MFEFSRNARASLGSGFAYNRVFAEGAFFYFLQAFIGLYTCLALLRDLEISKSRTPFQSRNLRDLEVRDFEISFQSICTTLFGKLFIQFRENPRKYMSTI